MDPIITAVIAAVNAGVVTGVTKLGENVIVDAYQALKRVLKEKLGAENDAVKAVDALEAKPDSPGRKETLKEEIKASRADQNQEILRAAQTLLDLLQAQPGGATYIQNAIGSYIAQADHSSTANININQKKETPDS